MNENKNNEKEEENPANPSTSRLRTESENSATSDDGAQKGKR